MHEISIGFVCFTIVDITARCPFSLVSRSTPAVRFGCAQSTGLAGGQLWIETCYLLLSGICQRNNTLHRKCRFRLPSAEGSSAFSSPDAIAVGRTATVTGSRLVHLCWWFHSEQLVDTASPLSYSFSFFLRRCYSTRPRPSTYHGARGTLPWGRAPSPLRVSAATRPTRQSMGCLYRLF